MDIAAISTLLSQQKVAQQESVSIMKMAMNTAERNNANLINIMDSAKSLETSVSPNLGTSIDVRV